MTALHTRDLCGGMITGCRVAKERCICGFFENFSYSTIYFLEKVYFCSRYDLPRFPSEQRTREVFE